MKYLYFVRKVTRALRHHQFHTLMEYMSGTDLQDYLSNPKLKRTIEDVKTIGGQLVSALQYLHQNRVVHLDIKPANIMVNE